MQYNVLHAGQSGTIISQSGYQERGHQKMAQNILFCCFFQPNSPPPFFYSERKPANVKQENELVEKRERIISCREGRGNGVSHVSKAT
jgi:hypothetical protein